MDIPEEVMSDLKHAWEMTTQTPMTLSTRFDLSTTIIMRLAQENKWVRHSPTEGKREASDEFAELNQAIVADFLHSTDPAESLLSELKSALKAPPEVAAAWVAEQMRKIAIQVPVALALTPRGEWVKQANNFHRLAEIAHDFIQANSAQREPSATSQSIRSIGLSELPKAIK